MEIVGRLKMIDETKAYGANGFRKRDVVVTTDEQYPQHILVEFTQDKCDILNSYQIGEPVKISINLRGREWVNPQGETRYFNSIQGWKIERTQPAGHAPQGYPQQGYGQPPQQQGYGYNGPGSSVDNYQQRQQYNNPAQAGPPQEEHDDLPF